MSDGPSNPPEYLNGPPGRPERMVNRSLIEKIQEKIIPLEVRALTEKSGAILATIEQTAPIEEITRYRYRPIDKRNENLNLYEPLTGKGSKTKLTWGLTDGNRKNQIHFSLRDALDANGNLSMGIATQKQSRHFDIWINTLDGQIKELKIAHNGIKYNALSDELPAEIAKITDRLTTAIIEKPERPDPKTLYGQNYNGYEVFDPNFEVNQHYSTQKTKVPLHHYLARLTDKGIDYIKKHLPSYNFGYPDPHTSPEQMS